jgi:hypothetical protein
MAEKKKSAVMIAGAATAVGLGIFAALTMSPATAFTSGSDGDKASSAQGAPAEKAEKKAAGESDDAVAQSAPGARVAKCLADPAGREWYCQVECNSTWGEVTFRNKKDGRKYASTRLYWDSGKVNATNKTRDLADTYHGIADLTSSKVVWPKNPPPDYAIIPKGREKNEKVPRPKKNHVLEFRTGKLADPAMARCKVK